MRDRSGDALAESYRKELSKIEEALLGGPSRGLLARAESLRDNLPTALHQTRELRSLITTAVQDVRTGVSIEKEVRQIQSQGRPKYAPPFTEVAARCKELYRVLTPNARAGPALRRWISRPKERLESEAAEPIQRATGKLMSDVDRDLKRIRAHELSTGEINSLLQLVVSTKKNLRQCLPGHTKFWNTLIPDATLGQIRASLDHAKRNEQSLSEHRERLETIAAELDKIDSFDTWKKSSQNLADEIEAVKSTLGKAPRSTGDRPAKELHAVIARVERERDKWTGHEESVRATLSHLANRTFRSPEAQQIIQTLKSCDHGDPLAKGLISAVVSLDSGFNTLEGTLDLDGVHTDFNTARQALMGLDDRSSGFELRESITEAQDYVTSCVERLSLLHSLTENMAQVRAGMVPDVSAPGEKRSVSSFFVDRLEVSTRDFHKFMVAMEEKSYDKVKDLWPSQEIFESSRQSFTQLKAKGNGSARPLDQVHYYHAEAYAAWQAKSLPTISEWLLAVKPTLEMIRARRKNASRNLWRDFNIQSQELQPPHKGEVNRGFSSDRSVHQLLGNVAEWCRWPEGDKFEPAITGRRYREDVPRKTDGKRLLAAFLRRRPWNENRFGVGFRTVVRPAEVFAELMPEATVAER